MKMKLSTALTAYALVASLYVTGCSQSGGEEMGDTSLTAFYIDEAVAGIAYECGLQQGFTDENGAFTFEDGKDCTFSIGDVVLRTTKASFLSMRMMG